VIDPSQKLDAVTDTAFLHGNAARIGPDTPRLRGKSFHL